MIIWKLSVVKNKIPRQERSLVLILATEPDERVELNAYRDVPLERGVLILKPHGVEAINYICDHEVIEEDLDLVQDKREIVQPRYHHV